LWLVEYFDMDNLVNQRFSTGLLALNTKVISYDYNNKLFSLDAIRTLINETPANKAPPQIKEELKPPKQQTPKNNNGTKEAIVVNENKLSENA